MFGRYQSQTTKQLTQIQSSKYPDTNKDMEANLRRLNQFVDYIAQYLQVMQKGVDQANEDAIQRIRSMASDMVVMLGGGELLYGINLGDLQYFLPALGAIFGFDSNKPFPISLFEMAEHFLLGYIIPLDSFTAEIEALIDGWLVAMGIDQETIDSIHQLLDAIGSVTTDSLQLFTDLWNLLDILGINTNGLGPFADLWHVITQLLGSFGLKQLGDLVDPVLHALAPWIRELAQFVSMLDSIIKAFSGGLTDIQGLLNLAGLITPFTDLMASAFDPLAAWGQIITGALNPAGIVGLLSGGILGGGLIPGIDASKIISGTFGAGLLQPVIDAVSTGFGGATGLNFGGLQSFLGGLSLVGISFADILGVIPGIGTGLSGSTGLQSVFTDWLGLLGGPTGLGSGTPTLPGIGSIPLLGGLLGSGSILSSLIPGLDASKIISGTLGASILQPVIDAVSQGFGGSTGLGFGGLQTFLGGLSFGGISFDDLIALIPGIGTGLTGSTGLGSIFTDLTGILGSPTGLGTGTTALPGIGSIPLLGGLLSGGNILGSLIPGLDASKIISGVFGTGLIPGLDISKITTGLLSGGSILTSLIPGLDASKIVTGLLGLAQIPNLPAGQITSGTFGLGLIPSLPASILTSGTLLSSLIPGLDASKIITGILGTGQIPNLPIGQITNLSTLLSGFGTSTSIITQLLGTIPNLTTGLGGLSGLTSVFTDITGLLGAPTALGSGTPVLPGISSIPVLSGLLGSGSILGSLIPGLDASKITTGVFGTGLIPNLPIGQITNLATLLTGFGTSSSILTQLIGVIPGLTSGLTGLGGLGSIFTDLTGLLGAPTALGSGTPVLPGIGSIPVLGGLLSGGNILGSIIPGLDASKIVSGAFGSSLIPGLDVSKIVSGVFGTGFIPSLPAGQITSGIFGSGLIPGLDASKIISGVLALGNIPNLPAGQVTSGVFGTGLIPNLPASIINSGTFVAGLIPTLDASKIVSGVLGTSQIPTLGRTQIPDLQSTIDQFITGWSGSTTTNAPPTDMNTTGAQIKQATLAGATVYIFNASNAAWLVPSGISQMTGVVMNGGGKGGTGTTAAGGIRGSSGGCLGGALSMTGITPGTSTLNITVGAAATVAGTAPAQADGGVSSVKFGATTLLQGAANANGYSDANQPVYSSTTSTPGIGGDGGFNATSGTAGNGTAGANSGVATGGAGGVGKGGASPGLPGGNGGVGASSSTPVCGGAGGGGGGNSQQGTGISAAVGGAGGNGGAPGGGSGGGGSAVSGGTKTQGVGGTPGVGLVVIITK